MNETKAEKKWLRVSEETNALDCLKRVCSLALQAEEDIMAWKWVVIALHSALYHFAISACKGTDSRNVTVPKGKGRWLIPMDEALKLCQDESHMLTCFSGQPIRISPVQQDSIQYLKSLRNQFEHYQPMDWRIAYQELPEKSMHVLDVIGELCRTGTWLPPEGFFEEVHAVVLKCRANLEQSGAHRECQRLLEQRENPPSDEGNLPSDPIRRNEEDGSGISCTTIDRPETWPEDSLSQDSGETPFEDAPEQCDCEY
jgi:hypothetical protein